MKGYKKSTTIFTKFPLKTIISLPPLIVLQNLTDMLCFMDNTDYWKDGICRILPVSESTGVGVEENSFHLSQMIQILAKLYVLQLNHSNDQRSNHQTQFERLSNDLPFNIVQQITNHGFKKRWTHKSVIQGFHTMIKGFMMPVTPACSINRSCLNPKKCLWGDVSGAKTLSWTSTSAIPSLGAVFLCHIFSSS